MPKQQLEQNPQEIERKFLINTPIDELGLFAGRVINQGYLAIEADGPEVRIRDNQGSYTMTVKTKGGMVRGEWETGITRQQFDTFWPATLGRRVEKTRYTLDANGKTVEVDVFSGTLYGLIMAEVEFESQDEANKYELPDWFGEEVSYKNRDLAVNGLPSAH